MVEDFRMVRREKLEQGIAAQRTLAKDRQLMGRDYPGRYLCQLGFVKVSSFKLMRDFLKAQLRFRSMIGFTLVLSLFCAAEIAAQKHTHARHDLGVVNFPVSCSPQAQSAFNYAVALLHHMTYPQARAAFQQVEKVDARCAMAYWGEAMTLFQPLWPTRPGPAALQQGWTAIEKAKTLQPPTERERLFISAGEAFFLDPASKDYWLRIRRWEETMQKVYVAFPQDSEAAAFYALAHLATTPSDRITRDHADRAAEILLTIYKKNPSHPGAMHYLVHANDVPGRERELMDITRKYDRVAPDNPHALHMPTHIYTRVGDWDGVISGNLRAANAALRYPAGDRGQFVWDEFCHAIEYLIYAYLQKSDNRAAAAQLERLRSTPRLEPSFKTAFHLTSTQARYVLERHAWKEAVALVPREPATLDWDRFTWPEAIIRFARGLGAARLNDVTQAKAERERLDQLEATTVQMHEELFARNIRMLRLELEAWIAHVEGNKEDSQRLMREAADLEETTPKAPVTPGPTIPARELLGDLLMAQNQPAQALAAYQRSLELYPRRRNSVIGAARAAALAKSPLAARSRLLLLHPIRNVHS
jgi:tetratricopeptide (TPR) repeat protein